MGLPHWSGTDHGTLAFLELSAVVVAILAAFFTLALAEVGFVVVRAAITALGGGETALTIGRVGIAAGTLLALVGGAGSLVGGYRRYFERRFDGVDPRPVVAVPLLALVAAIGYARWSGDSLLASPRLFLPTAVATYALAYRTLALDALRADRRRMGTAVGALAGLPAVVALLDLARHLLDPAFPIAGTLETVVDTTGVPAARSLFLVVPLLVTSLYVVATRYGPLSEWNEDGLEGNWKAKWDRYRGRTRDPNGNRGGGDAATGFRSRLREVGSRVRTRSFARRLAKGVAGLSPLFGRSTDGSAARPARSGTGPAVVPSSPKSTGGRSRSPSDADSDADAEPESNSESDSESDSESVSNSSPESNDPASATDTDAERADAAPTDEEPNRFATDRRRDDGDGGTESGGGDDGDNSNDSDDRDVGDETEEPDGRDSGDAGEPNDTDEPGAPRNGAEPGAGAGSSGVASDTRIFVPDSDRYGSDESSGETPVETCPECDDEIPSDGVYNFCPFCGAEL